MPLLKVQVRQCATCIYKKTCTWDVKELERQVSDPKISGFFVTFRACHHAPSNSHVVCKGFWNRHKNHFTLGQLAQRLGGVAFVWVDRFKDHVKSGEKALESVNAKYVKRKETQNRK